MQAAVSSGFRNSGISCGKKGKIMVVGQLAIMPDKFRSLKSMMFNLLLGSS